MKILGEEIDLNAIPENGHVFKIERQGILFVMIVNRSFEGCLDVKIKLGSVFNGTTFLKEALDDPGFLPHIDRIVLNCMFNKQVVDHLLYEN
ncbi:MAG: hypothetical protein [Bacteriophage sp.]|nr:MAG: hypothetical protein [Bacteriophage sp.]